MRKTARKAPTKAPTPPVIVESEIHGLTALKRNTNIFVIGDLLIDHTVFVDERLQHYPMEVSGELAFRVRRRIDTAGGAATTARCINSLADGNTFLWGLIGKSPWGSFRAVLEAAQTLDGAKNRIEFRGVRDETDASMTTISRLVAIHNTDEGKVRYERKARFADDGQIHIPMNRQVSGLQHHLDRIHHHKVKFDCIVLNDLDLGALNREAVAAVAEFAEKNEIPLIVRARRDATKYVDVHMKALVCTLADWKLLTGAPETIEYWKTNISQPDLADDFARRSLGTFRNTDSFVVLVGDDWIDSIVVVGSGASSGEAAHVDVLPGMRMAEKGRSQQVGASDVFTGAMAFAFGNRSRPNSNAYALDIARLVTEAYQGMGWHHVPRFESLRQEALPATRRKGNISKRSFGTPFLPRKASIDMVDARTDVDGLFSVTIAMREKLQQLVHDVEKGDKSIVLVASGGSGKSAIAKRLLVAAAKAGLETGSLVEMGIRWSWNTPDKTVAAIDKAFVRRPPKKAFVVVDEVLKYKGSENVSTKGVVLLDAAASSGIRFLMIDADFRKMDRDDLKSQFGRRVFWHELPSAWERPKDIPYVLGSCLRNAAGSRNLQFSIDASALVSIIEWVIGEKQNFGSVATLATDIVNASQANDHLNICWNDLPLHVKGKHQPLRGSGEVQYPINFE